MAFFDVPSQSISAFRGPRSGRGKIARDSANLTHEDLREMEPGGSSKEEIQQMIAFAAYWNLNIVFSQAALAAPTEE